RERIVMSLQTEIGPECNVHEPKPEYAAQIVMNSPVLSQRKIRQLVGPPGVGHGFIDLHYPAGWSLTRALDAYCERAGAAVKAGKLMLMLSDRYLQPDKVPVHALLATGAVHHHLVGRRVRGECNLVIETGTARDSHQVACLIAYGATAVYPYLVYQTLADMVRTGEIKVDATGQRQLGRAYRRGIRKGLFKIMSKMGISTISSYRGAQLFEIVGLADEVVERCFKGTTSRVQGAEFADLEQDARTLMAAAYNERQGVDQGGLLKFVHGGEYHAFNPDVVATLQAAVRTGSYEHYRHFAKLV